MADWSRVEPVALPGVVLRKARMRGWRGTSRLMALLGEADWIVYVSKIASFAGMSYAEPISCTGNLVTYDREDAKPVSNEGATSDSLSHSLLTPTLAFLDQVSRSNVSRCRQVESTQRSLKTPKMTRPLHIKQRVRHQTCANCVLHTAKCWSWLQRRSKTHLKK